MGKATHLDPSLDAKPCPANAITWVVTLLLAACISEASAQTAELQDSLGRRLERIRGLTADLLREVDSLERELAGHPRLRETAGVTAGVTAGDTARPILEEIMSAKERKLAAAASTPFKRMAVGYTADPDMPIGMHFLAWGARWGWSAAAAARSGESFRVACGELAVFRSLHRFELFEGLKTHLYAFAGSGLYWRREPFNTYFSGIPGGGPSGRYWYGNPDIYARLRLGAGSELGLVTLGGIKAAPEVGFQGQRYFSRYQDSREWEAKYVPTPGFDEKPQSDFSLGIFFAFHLSFYFL